MEIGSLVGSVSVGSVGAIAAWFATNFVASPILALRAKRLEALQVAERYSNVDFMSSDELRDRALKAFNDTASSLRALSRERSLGVRLGCRLFGYDLAVASRCLLGLAEGPRGEYRVTKDQRKMGLNALFVYLGAAHDLSPAEVEAVREEVKKALAAPADTDA